MLSKFKMPVIKLKSLELTLRAHVVGPIKTIVIFIMFFFSNLCTLDSKSAEFSIECSIEEQTIWAGERSQLSRAVSVLAEDCGLDPSIHMAAPSHLELQFQGI